MTGINLTVPCSKCNAKSSISLGHTQYVRVNGSSRLYLLVKCRFCGQPLYVAHVQDEVTEVEPAKEDDKIEPGTIICW